MTQNTRFSLLYVRYGSWGLEDHKTREGVINSVISGSDYGLFAPIAIIDRVAKSFEIYRVSESWPDAGTIERKLEQMTGDRFLFTGGLVIDWDD